MIESQELCINALNNVRRPPEIDESPSNMIFHSNTSTSLVNFEGETIGLSTSSKDEVRKKEIEFTPNVTNRKRKLRIDSTGTENIIGATPLSPYSISADYAVMLSDKLGLSHISDLDTLSLKSLIEVREKEISEMISTFSFEKAQYRVEILRLKDKIKEEKKENSNLENELKERDREVLDLKMRLDELESENKSIKESYEALIEAEKHAVCHLKRELQQERAISSSLEDYRSRFNEQQDYKLKYNEAIKRIQTLELELIYNRSNQRSVSDDNIYLSSENSIPIILGRLDEPKIAFQDGNIRKTRSLEVSIEIRDNFDNKLVQSSSKLRDIELISRENKILMESYLKLQEELEAEKNKLLMANIRQITQKPLLISSCTNTKLTMNNISEMESNINYTKLKFLELKTRKVVSLNIVDIYVKNRFQCVKCVDYKIHGTYTRDNNSQTDLNSFVMEIKRENSLVHLGQICYIQCIEEDLMNNEEDPNLSLFNLAFENYHLTPNLLNLKQYTFEDEVFGQKRVVPIEEYSVTTIKSVVPLFAKSEFHIKKELVRKVLLLFADLREDLEDIRKSMCSIFQSPQNMFSIVKSILCSEEDINNINNKNIFLYDVSISLAKIYRLCLGNMSHVESLIQSQQNEWYRCFDTLQNHISRLYKEKSELLDEINNLKVCLKNTEDEKKRINNEMYDMKDDTISCYTFKAGSICDSDINDHCTFDSPKLKASIDDIEKSIHKDNNEYINEVEKSGGEQIESCFGNLNRENENLDKTIIKTQIEGSSLYSEHTEKKSEISKFDKIIELQTKIRSIRNHRNGRSLIEMSSNQQINVDNTTDSDTITIRRSHLELFGTTKHKVMASPLSKALSNSLKPPLLPIMQNDSFDNMEDISSTVLMLRLHRYHKYFELLQNHITFLTMERQKIQLTYERDVQSAHIELLSSKLQLEAREAELRSLSEKYNSSVVTFEGNINHIRLSARDEIERLWKPKLFEKDEKCKELKNQIHSLEAEILLLRQQLSFKEKITNKYSLVDKNDESFRQLYMTEKSAIENDCPKTDESDISSPISNNSDGNQNLSVLNTALLKLKSAVFESSMNGQCSLK
ncbi:uncharacterized protein CMU_024680 [Cryptosporidium muris RN66]|uniref:Uncharacterized protein n=1 Tax=Cryptosporidium muris (strain RN66) TaxID=441375 RepID=B6AAR0_CRYMR|nr:uncharacterized protein CMU_024680 [Cryptosporidium muris RN66]EEA05462.1 hypothetical protein, conserved [Cryptosporidium muris RN66]|eukprot:XP_002139811.1 hypothetical protein [Cryptosporidium muris RN66]